MAKRKKEKQQTGDDKGGKLKGILIVISAVLLFLVILIILIKMDLGGFGSKVLRPILKDVPVVNKILPAATDDEIAKESGYDTLEEAVAKINELEQQLDAAKKAQNTSAAKDTEATSDKDDQIKELEKEIKRLKTYEENQKKFEKTKTDFYNQVVYNDKAPDASTYSQWYESMDKDTAAKIYREVVGKQADDAEKKALADTYSAMKPAQAAAILQNMTGDLDAVVSILKSMEAEKRGLVLGAMDSAFAAKITKKMTS